jgi:MOSC domain-containing protein YiiM
MLDKARKGIRYHASSIQYQTTDNQQQAISNKQRVTMMMKNNTQKESAKIVAVSVSLKKGVKKTNIRSGILVQNHGLENDAHAGDWHRQVSLLAMESIDKIRAKGLEVGPGDFAENITTEGIRLWELPVGTRMKLGGDALVEVTQIGKECHDRCAIFHQVGDCVMPREGIFVRIIAEGEIKPGDFITYETSC